MSGDNSVNIQGRIMICVHSTSSHCPSIYKPSFISIPFLLNKIWLRQASIMKSKWLQGDNSINIQGRIMVLGFCPYPHCHLSIYQVLFLKLLAGQSCNYMLPPLGDTLINITFSFWKANLWVQLLNYRIQLMIMESLNPKLSVCI